MPESSRSTDAPPSTALDLVRRALAHRPAGILTDFDGTLAPIVADPASARLASGAEAALASLARRLEVIAIVTGRAPLDARRLVGVPGLLIVGNHGTEWLDPDAASPEPSAGAAEATAVVSEVVRRAAAVADVSIEAKGLSATIHYRNARDPAATREAILAAVGDPPAPLELRDGRMSVEVRPVGLGDKGSAARSIVERYRLRGAVVLGDDLTDLDMFAAVAELRDAGRLAGAIVAVGGADREVPPTVREAADAVLSQPEDVADLLAALATD